MPVKYDYDWETLHKEQQQSGMNMKQFCRERNLPYQSFKNHKYFSKGTSNTIDIAPVVYEDQRKLSFIINGIHLSVDASLDDEGLRRIVKALQ